MNTTWKAALGVILIFILGWFGGALTTLAIAHHRVMAVIEGGPESMATLLERSTTRGIGLDDNQKKQLHALLVENVKGRMELQRQIQPQVKAVNRRTMQAIDAVLTPDQQRLFLENLAKFKQRFGRNPLNVGADDKSAPTDKPGAAVPGTNTPTTNAPAASK